jgi:hypothetical protein
VVRWRFGYSTFWRVCQQRSRTRSCDRLQRLLCFSVLRCRLPSALSGFCGSCEAANSRKQDAFETSPTKRRPLILASVLIVLAVSGFAAVRYAYHIGNQEGERSIARLSLVWPSIMAMSQEDRAMLAGLSLSCRLQDRPAVKSAIITCLEDAAADPNAVLPKGFDQRSAQARLRVLLSQQPS